MATLNPPLNSTTWTSAADEASWTAVGLAGQVSAGIRRALERWRAARIARANLRMMSARDAADIGTTLTQLEFNAYHGR